MEDDFDFISLAALTANVVVWLQTERANNDQANRPTGDPEPGQGNGHVEQPEQGNADIDGRLHDV